MDDAQRASAISIVIADKDIPFVYWLALFLERDAEFSVVGVASDIDETVLKVSACRPDVVLVDVDSVARDLATITRLRKTSPSLVIIALAAVYDQARRQEAVESGADGMLVLDRIVVEGPTLIRFLTKLERRPQ